MNPVALVRAKRTPPTRDGFSRDHSMCHSLHLSHSQGKGNHPFLFGFPQKGFLFMVFGLPQGKPDVAARGKPPIGCGSKNRNQNGALASGNKGQNLRNPWLILSHTQFSKEFPLTHPKDAQVSSNPKPSPRTLPLRKQQPTPRPLDQPTSGPLAPPRRESEPPLSGEAPTPRARLGAAWPLEVHARPLSWTF